MMVKSELREVRANDSREPPSFVGAQEVGEKGRKHRVSENGQQVFARDGRGAGQTFPQRYPRVQTKDGEGYPCDAVRNNEPEESGVPGKIGLCRVGGSEQVDDDGGRIEDSKAEAEEEQPSSHSLQLLVPIVHDDPPVWRSRVSAIIYNERASIPSELSENALTSAEPMRNRSPAQSSTLSCTMRRTVLYSDTCLIAQDRSQGRDTALRVSFSLGLRGIRKNR